MALQLDNSSGLPLDPATLQALQEQNLMRSVAEGGGSAADRLTAETVGRGVNTLFPSLAMRQSQQMSDALQAQNLQQQPGESTIDFSIRQLTAAQQQAARIDPMAAIQMGNQLAKLSEMKSQQAHLDADTQDAQDRHAAFAAQAPTRALEGQTGGLGSLYKFDKSGQLISTTYDLNNRDEQQAFLAARQKDPALAYATPAQLAQLQRSANSDDTKLAATLLRQQSQQGGALDDNGRKFLAHQYLMDPSALNGLPRNSPDRQAIINMAAAERANLGMTDGQVMAMRANVKAEGKSIGQMTGMLNNVSAYDVLLRANGDRILQLIDGVDVTGVPAIEGFARAAKAKGGNVDTNEFRSVLNSFQTEAARILNNPNLTGVLSDSARQDLQKVVGGDLDAPSMRRVINRLYLESEMRKNGLQQQIGLAGQSIGSQLRSDQVHASTVPVPSGNGAPPAATTPPKTPVGADGKALW